MNEQEFKIVIDKFYQGFGPAAHLNTLSELGNPGHAGDMENVDVTDPTYLNQGPHFEPLANGNESGAITEKVNFILDKPATDGITYGIGDTKLQQILQTGVTNVGDFPHSITNSTQGESVIDFQGNLYYFYNTSSGGDIGIFDYFSSFDDDWGSTVPVGAAALEQAPHPSAKKENILLFGNGRYIGKYDSSTGIIEMHKLDFGENTEVVDICFHANQWWIAVISGFPSTSNPNRISSQVYLYDGAAISSVLFDELAVGVQRIGFIIPFNGVIYLCFEDVSGTNVFGYINGREIKRLSYFSSDLPTFAMKTIYRQFILFGASGNIFLAGAAIQDLPFAISQIGQTNETDSGCIAAPFGIPMASSQDTISHTAELIAIEAGVYETNSRWNSLVLPLTDGRNLGYLDSIVVETNTLASGAGCKVIPKFNQATVTGATKAVSGNGQRRFYFDNLEMPQGGVEDIQLFINWSNSTNDSSCAIRRIILSGHMVEK